LTTCRRTGSIAGNILTFALGTGMRISEILGLTRSQVNNIGDEYDPDSSPEIKVVWQLIKIRKRLYLDVTKTKENRTLPLVNPRLWDILRRRLASPRLREPMPVWGSERTVDDVVFVNKKGRPVSAETLRGQFDKALAAAGLPFINIHRQRHTFSTLCREEGGVED
jgi:integrase